MEKKVSVIVPVYNAETYLQKTAERLLNQTLQDIEIILINDGSNDNSGRICDMIASSDARIKVLHQANQGVSSARNNGIEAASGEYMMFCDADDLPDHTMVETLYLRAVEEQADCVLCDFVKVVGEKKVIDRLPSYSTLADREVIIDKLVMPMLVWGYAPEGQRYPGVYGSVWRGLYRTSFVSQNHIRFETNIRLGEDMLFNETLWPKCIRVAFVQEPLYQYNENVASATHTNASVMWSQYLDVWEKAHELLVKLGADTDKLRWHNYQLTRYAVSAVIEGVCVQPFSPRKKADMIREILSNEMLQQARTDLPDKLGKKERSLCNMLTPSTALIVWAYYQRTVSSAKQNVFGKDIL